MTDGTGDFVTESERPRARRPRLVDGVDARLLEDIRNAPDDDGPRLVWADAVGGERGELVVIQIDLERGGLSPREVIARKKRQRELLARHGAEWSGLAGIARRASFRRGFVDAAEIPAPVFLAHADAIGEAAPLLSSLTATGLRADGPARDPVPLLSKLCADPAARELRGLELVTETTGERAGRLPGELALEALVTSGMLRRLRALGSRDLLGMHGLRALANPRALHALERLWLGDIADADALRMLLATPLPQLRSLDVGPRCPLGPLAPLVPPTVTELVVGQLAPGGLAALAKSPVAATLEVLHVQETVGLAWFEALPRLRALWLHAPFSLAQTPDAERGVRRELATRTWRALRELACTGGIREDIARIVAGDLGPQLDLLDLRGSPAALRFVNDLKRPVAGELRVGTVNGDAGRHVRRGLLRVGPTLQLPWWDHVTLA